MFRCENHVIIVVIGVCSARWGRRSETNSTSYFISEYLHGSKVRKQKWWRATNWSSSNVRTGLQQWAFILYHIQVCSPNCDHWTLLTCYPVVLWGSTGHSAGDIRRHFHCVTVTGRTAKHLHRHHRHIQRTLMDRKVLKVCKDDIDYFPQHVLLLWSFFMTLRRNILENMTINVHKTCKTPNFLTNIQCIYIHSGAVF